MDGTRVAACSRRDEVRGALPGELLTASATRTAGKNLVICFTTSPICRASSYVGARHKHCIQYLHLNEREHSICTRVYKRMYMYSVPHSYTTSMCPYASVSVASHPPYAVQCTYARIARQIADQSKLQYTPYTAVVSIRFRSTDHPTTTSSPSIGP